MDSNREIPGLLVWKRISCYWQQPIDVHPYFCQTWPKNLLMACCLVNIWVPVAVQGRKAPLRKTSIVCQEGIPELCLLLREWNRLELLDSRLNRKGQENAQTIYQLLLPEELRPFVLKSLHDDIGHMGLERTLDLVRTQFYWPKMSVDVKKQNQNLWLLCTSQVLY